MDAERLTQINRALQEIACSDPSREIRAVDAARRLHVIGLLRDSQGRPVLPLRKLIRAGKIAHARQQAERWWFIDCGEPAA
jgi:hypothetical protein